MNTFSSPYYFIPLSPIVFKPDWSQLVTQDHPFQSGLRGEISLTIRTHTATCVGGEQEPATAEKPGKVKFARQPNGDLFIPGSSLRGALRNVVEIATFGQIQHLEDQKFSVRDLSSANNSYMKKMKSARPGWLRFENKKWTLTPCEYLDVHHETIVTELGIEKNQWKAAKTVPEKYELLDGLRDVQFKREELEYHSNGISNTLKSGDQSGLLVVTGQPGGDYESGKGAKKWEFIFFNKQEPVNVPSNVMSDFLHIHESDDSTAPWNYWRSRLSSEPGVPVFWISDSNSATPKAIGLARLFRLPSAKSTHGMLENTGAAHSGQRSWDMASLLFGNIADDKNHVDALRGRVSVGNLFTATALSTKWTGPTVLSSPKPSFYPGYLKQGPHGTGWNDWMNSQSELAGWKKYAVKPVNVLPPPENVNSKKTQVQLETIPEGFGFSGKLRFHNLLPVEIGCLLWSLDFGGRADLRHSLGEGKPFGMGQIGIEVKLEGCALAANCPDAMKNQSVEEVFHQCRAHFVEFMDALMQSAFEDEGVRWEETHQLQQLLALANPVSARGKALDYPTDLTDFRGITTAGDRLNSYAPTRNAARPSRLGPDQPELPKDFDDLRAMVSEAIEKERARKEQEKARKQREEELATLPEAQRGVQKIQDLIESPELKTTKTQKKRLESSIRSLLEYDRDDFDMDELKIMLERAQGLEIKAVSNACKKIENFMFPD